jgi:methionyl-tRNA synthetase
MIDKNDLEKKSYQGLYCVGCEAFYSEDELENGLCKEHHTKPELVTEQNHFFKLSKYKEILIQKINSKE